METNYLMRKCRICYVEFRYGVHILSEESRRIFLQAKIRRYLSFTISTDDALPKFVCTECCTKLDGFHRFATIALQNQEQMSKDVISNVNKHEDEQTETRSLLHSYLTKGIKEEQPECTEIEVTEVEVRVDPMSIIQYVTDDEDENDIEVKTERSNDNDDEQSEEELMIKTENLSETENEDNNKKLFLCQLCPRAFTLETALQMHMLSHPSQPKRILSFNNIQPQINQILILEAIKQTEENVNNNNNNKCANEADSDDTVDDVFDECLERDGVSCPICGKLIDNKGNLNIHVKTHRPKGRYKCDSCTRVFKTECNLYRHLEYHVGVQYTCEVCGRVYPTNSTLRAHSITHSDLRPHGCPMCGKTFKRNQDLKFHINQHTGERPYKCPYCPKAFASSGNCFSHRKRMHRAEVERDRERAAKIMR